MGTYRYDACGNILYQTNAALLNKNPLRYRGYIYDNETGFYYLQSRYYDPKIGRFLNADSYASTGQGFIGFNMYAYCNNSPVDMSDTIGNYPVELVDGYTVAERVYPKGYYVNFSKKYTNRPDSGLIGVPDEKIRKKARDKSLSGKERNRYKEEEKRRGFRNKQKRANHFSEQQVIRGAGVVAVSVVGIIYVIVNDVTGAGVADNFLLGPLGVNVGKGIGMIFVYN